jgi:hypothetical protein
MHLLLAGNSFIAKHTGEYPGWAELLEQDYKIHNVAQFGVGQYKILKQLQKVNLNQYDAVIICQSSPYLIHTAYHPLHKEDSLYGRCDFIYEDIKGRVPDVEKFFKEYLDLEYAEFIHNLIVNEIATILRDCRVIDCANLGLRQLFETNRGTVQHLDKQGNITFYNKLKKALK